MRFDIDRVNDHLKSDDPSSVLLKGHLWVDYLLVDLITASLEFPEVFKDLDRMSFPSKVGLAGAQGNLIWPASLRELNRIRNKLAHEPT